MSRSETSPTLPPADRSALLSRREAIGRVSALLGGAALVGQAGLLEAVSGTQPASASASASAAGLGPAQITFLGEVAETILPETSTPGAKAAGVGPFMALMVADTYSPEEQQIFRDGMGKLDQACTASHGVGFMDASPEARLSLLERLDEEQFEYMTTHEEGEPVHYFRMMKELALVGYFTSEVGYTKAMRYRETPGRFDPCVPYEPGGKAWADHA